MFDWITDLDEWMDELAGDLVDWWDDLWGDGDSDDDDLSDYLENEARRERIVQDWHEWKAENPEAAAELESARERVLESRLSEASGEDFDLEDFEVEAD